MALKLEIVEWLDHAGDVDSRQWKRIEELPKNPLSVTSIGWVLREDKQLLILASACGEEVYSSVQEILKAAIVSRRKVKA